ncbi:hypothetical protein CHOED_048 [Vibrio phage CHOED]|uniref:hypothetical protein n=1 Tax=Vibrio phage CHOED TaxID=1458716 RepID=UPI00042E3047|nr:hypothetical protein CHOED_048 [Vibrio phage CHOED]AHK11908.1 hypothetical protein CHOED_048 [Vibrio phage CHOED]
MSLNLGTIYVTKSSDGFPIGTRVEFIGGPDDDCFTDGESIEYFSSEEVLRSSNQQSIECSPYIQQAKASTMSGFDPD